MGSAEIIVGRHWKHDVQFLKNLRRHHRFHTELDLIEIRDIIDIVLDGINITSHVAEESIFGVLDGLLEAVAQLLEGSSTKAIIEFHCEPWEMVLQPQGRQFLVSLYGVSQHHRVLAHDLAIGADNFVEALSRAAESLLSELYRISESFSTDTFVRAFSARLGRIQDYKRRKFLSVDPPADAAMGTHQGGTSSPSGWTLSYRYDADYGGLRSYRGEHDFDLHALLCRGEIVAEINGERVALTPGCVDAQEAHTPGPPPPFAGYPLLSTCALLKRCRQALNRLETSQENAFDCAEALGHLNLAIFADGPHWTLELGDAPADRPPVRVETTPREALELFLSLSELLLADVLATNPLIELNHRWSDLEREARELRAWFEEFSGSNSYHDEPERFIETLGHILPQVAPLMPPARLPWRLDQMRALFAQPAWQFGAERIEFNQISAAPDTLVVPTTNALYALDPETGQTRWRRADLKMNRLSHRVLGERVLLVEDGRGIESVDLRSGARVFANHQAELRSWRRVLGAASYAGENRLLACDAQGRVLGLARDTGKLQWSFNSSHGRFVGAHFWGPLVTALTGEGFLFCVNPIDGALLWKIRLGGLTDTSPQAHQGRLYAVSQDALHQKISVHSIYPFTGRSAWQLRLDGVLTGPLSFVGDWMILAVEQHGQLSLRGVDIERNDPRVEWTLDLSSAGMDAPTPVLGVEDPALTGARGAWGLVQTDRAEISCFEICTGALRWRVSPEEDTWLLQGNMPLRRIEEAVLAVGQQVALHDLRSGELLHTLEPELVAPEFALARGALSLILGTRGATSESGDLLNALSLNHFIARIK